jgi:glyoxylase-like metal-dependent hydrolase (beta-lactamase superfamily II)
MHIERFFVPGLAHASYLLASEDEAVVVDPERNMGGYLAYLARNKLKLTGIFLTHPHADFVAPATLSFPSDLVLRSLFPGKLLRPSSTATSKRVTAWP